MINKQSGDQVIKASCEIIDVHSLDRAINMESSSGLAIAGLDGTSRNGSHVSGVLVRIPKMILAKDK